MSLNILQVIADPDMEICSEYIYTGYMREVDEVTIKMLLVTEPLLTTEMLQQTAEALQQTTEIINIQGLDLQQTTQTIQAMLTT